MSTTVTIFLVLYFLSGILFYCVMMLVNNLNDSNKNTGSHHYFSQTVLPNASTTERIEDICIQSLAAFSLLLFWPCVAIWIGLKILNAGFAPNNVDTETTHLCETRFLVALTSLAHAEKNGVIDDPTGLMPRQPFGYLFPAWVEFCARAGFDSEIWSFTISKGACYGPHGQIAQMDIHGYAIVENQKIMDEFLVEFH